MTTEENLVEPAGRDVDGHALLELQRLSKFFGNIIAVAEHHHKRALPER